VLFKTLGATRLDWNLHARQDPHAQDFPHPNLQGPSVAESTRVGRHGLVSGTQTLKRFTNYKSLKEKNWNKLLTK
jgi:hypothetical protein